MIERKFNADSSPTWHQKSLEVVQTALIGSRVQLYDWITTVESKSKYVYCLLFTTRKNTPVLSAKLRWSALPFGWLVSHSPVLHYPLEALFWADESICWNLHQHDWAIIEANIGKWLSMQHRWVCCFPSENQTHPSYSVFPGRPTVGGWLMI